MILIDDIRKNAVLKNEDLILLNIIQIKTYETFVHCYRVGKLCQDIFDKEDNNIEISEDLKNKIIRAAYIHDIGKAFLFFEYQNFPYKLTEEEKEYVKNHSSIGFSLIKDVYPEEISKIILEHHYTIDQEPWIWSQFVSCLDKFDALTSDRSYRNSLDIETSLAIIENSKLFGFKYLKNYCEDK